MSYPNATIKKEMIMIKGFKTNNRIFEMYEIIQYYKKCFSLTKHKEKFEQKDFYSSGTLICLLK